MKAIIAVLALMVSGTALADPYFECGSVACPNATPWDLALADPGHVYKEDITGINGLNVSGKLFDVTFTAAAPATSPFVLSASAASPKDPLTGVDAGNAISVFYGGLLPPYANGYDVAGDAGPAFITAFAPSGALSAQYFGATTLWDVAQTSVGGGAVPVKIFGNNGFSADGKGIRSNNNNEVYYTSWTAIKAPEIDPGSAGGALTLLAAGVAVMRGRRRVTP